MRKAFFVLFGLFLLAAPTVAAPPSSRTPLPFKVGARLPDVVEFAPLSQVHLGGYLGPRIDRNEAMRLLNVDTAPLLAGYHQKPGSHPWIGEHIGKWLHAATLAWAYTGDNRLRKKLDATAQELILTQEADGYLGTYTPDKRFGLYDGADWDVWSHKYNLIGLLTYYQYTGSPDALAASRRMGDLLLRTFGPGKKSILSAGTHVGMAATSVLEPMVLLYRTTGDARYLEFCRYIVRSWDGPGGPKILTTLTTEKSVAKTGNGKAYEMLSNLVGLCELARATGDNRYLVPAVNAWEDIVARQRYITGTASYKEHFHDDNDLPNSPSADIGETCVTVTWIQLNAQLLRLTGQARYGDEIERSLCNHLAAAQRPDGREWCYYTALEGMKPYGPGISCCVSSGPRGMAMAPGFAYLTRHQAKQDTLAVNLLDASRVTVRLGGQTVTARLQSGFPRSGEATLTFQMAQPAMFGLQVRSPEWAHHMQIATSGGPSAHTRNGWTTLPARRWKNGDSVHIRFTLAPRIVPGTYGNRGKAALTWGPFVMAYDRNYNAYLPSLATTAWEAKAQEATRLLKSPGLALVVTAPVRSPSGNTVWNALFLPFADAGASGRPYRIWIPTSTTSASLLSLGVESRSSAGNVNGSINDGSRDSFAVTYDGKPQSDAWFAVALDEPTTVQRLVFVQGPLFHDGGWFDTMRGKPRLEVQRTQGGDWEPVGTLDTYPDTTATDAGMLKAGQAFPLLLAQPQTIVAVRVIGRPASGDNPAQAFASCAELQAFLK